MHLRTAGERRFSLTGSFPIRRTRTIDPEPSDDIGKIYVGFVNGMLLFLRMRR